MRKCIQKRNIHGKPLNNGCAGNEWHVKPGATSCPDGFDVVCEHHVAKYAKPKPATPVKKKRAYASAPKRGRRK